MFDIVSQTILVLDCSAEKEEMMMIRVRQEGMMDQGRMEGRYKEATHKSS